jgi:uncharacterized metal-binding protein YceD (DUF177 family)
MNGKRVYDIAFVGLTTGVHEYEYIINDKFFAEYNQQDFTNCNAIVKVKLDKKTGFFLLKFEIGGNLQVLCDRCGNNLPMDLWDEFNIVVKLVENPEEMNDQEEDPDVYYISRTESHLNMADWIYEFINLAIPLQKMCSEAEIGGPHCNKEVLEKLNQMKPGEIHSNDIWKGLEQFKNLKKAKNKQ